MKRMDWLLALQAATAALVAARTPEEVAAIVLSQGCAAVGATDGLIYLLTADGAWLERVQPAGQAPGLPRPCDRVSVTDPYPICEALRTGSAVWPAAEKAEQGAGGAGGVLPLCVQGRAIGVIALRFVAAPAGRVPDREAMLSLAQVTAHVLERTLLYSRQQERARAAEELARERSRLVAEVCHELRTPLNAIIGFTEMLRRRWSQSSEDERLELLQRVMLSATRQQLLINDLLVMSKLEAEELTSRREHVALATLARLAAEEVRDSYGGQHILTTGPLDTRVLVDTGRAVQVLTNLLDNAAKYSPDGSSITISWRTEGGMAVVRVRDQGPGVPVDGRERLFTHFGRIPGSQARPGRSRTGLGLYLSRRLATAMGGDLDLERTGPWGSTFRLRLPIAPG